MRRSTWAKLRYHQRGRVGSERQAIQRTACRFGYSFFLDREQSPAPPSRRNRHSKRFSDSRRDFEKQAFADSVDCETPPWSWEQVQVRLLIPAVPAHARVLAGKKCAREHDEVRPAHVDSHEKWVAFEHFQFSGFACPWNHRNPICPSNPSCSQQPTIHRPSKRHLIALLSWRYRDRCDQQNSGLDESRFVVTSATESKRYTRSRVEN